MLEFDRMPPGDVKAEMALLSSMILAGVEPTKQREIIGAVRREEWFQPDHAVIHAQLCEMVAAGVKIDPLTLRDRLEQKGKLAEIGGTAYLSELVNSAPSYAHAESYSAIVRRTAMQRGGIMAATELLKAMYEGGFDEDRTPAGVIQEQIGRLWKLTQDATAQSYRMLGDVVADVMKLKAECPAGNNLLTGVATIDEYAGIFRQKATTIIAARPSMGKSTLIRWLLSLFASNGVRCGLVAVEEDQEKVARNYLAQMSGIENSKLAGESLCTEEWESLAFAQSKVSDWPVVICDDCKSAEDVATAIEVMATQYGCTVVATDHIQKLYLRGRWENRNQEMTRISAMLSATHKRLGVCGILASQLNRPETKHGCPPPPSMHNLRESGSIEQDADAVLFIHREDYYRKAERGFMPTHEAKIVVEKNRDGCTGFFTLIEELKYQRFRELTMTEAQQQAGDDNIPD